MKYRLVGVLTVVVTIAAVLLLRPTTPDAPNVRIALRSDPYPLVIGQTTLRVAVTDQNGEPLEAEVALTSEMLHDGMLPFNPRMTTSENGEYQFPMIWPMVGQWTVAVTAQLSDDSAAIVEQFDVYVYPVTMNSEGNETEFRAASVSAALISDPAREMAIIIPQGTKAMMNTMQGDDVIPSEILLNVSGQNTLILQNNDIVDHVVGPFNIRAGEVIRQTFTRPAEYVGQCSANLGSEVSIIVEA